MKTITDAVRILNEMLALDKDATSKLVGARVTCNEGLVDHPTIQVTLDSKVGLLGVLNGIFGDGDKVIAVSMLGDNGDILSFYEMEKLHA